MDGLIFLLATEDDFDEILAFYKNLIGTPGCLWTEDYPNEDTAREDIRHRSLYLLRDRSDKLISVATAGGVTELDELDWGQENLCELGRIGVLQSAQGKGIAGLMIQRIIPVIQAKGYGGIRLIAGKTNPAALRLYEKNGFARSGEAAMFGHEYYCYELIF